MVTVTQLELKLSSGNQVQKSDDRQTPTTTPTTTTPTTTTDGQRHNIVRSVSRDRRTKTIKIDHFSVKTVPCW